MMFCLSQDGFKRVITKINKEDSPVRCSLVELPNTRFGAQVHYLQERDNLQEIPSSKLETQPLFIVQSSITRPLHPFSTAIANYRRVYQ